IEDFVRAVRNDATITLAATLPLLQRGPVSVRHHHSASVRQARVDHPRFPRAERRDIGPLMYHRPRVLLASDAAHRGARVREHPLLNRLDVDTRTHRERSPPRTMTKAPTSLCFLGVSGPSWWR